METEYQVLNHLQENEITTQRKIAQRTGLSLGAVNILIKKMVRKGLVKVEKLNTRTVRYVLTPQGLQEKARLTYRFIRQSYRQLVNINEALDRLLTDHSAALDGQPVIILGPGDEIAEILKQRLKELDLPCRFYATNYPEDQLPILLANELVIVWREEEEEPLRSNPRTANIMKLL